MSCLEQREDDEKKSYNLENDNFFESDGNNIDEDIKCLLYNEAPRHDDNAIKISLTDII